LNRKSIRIVYSNPENPEPTQAIYYNKCAFYLQLMNEKLKTSTSQPFDLAKVSVSKLEPEDYPIVSQEWFHALEKGAPSTEALIREKIKRIMESNQISSQTMPKDVCPACDAKVPNLADHLLKFVQLEDQNCSLCTKTSLVNTCAHSTHQSLHLNPAFRVCPECAIHIDKAEDFNKHLKECLHFNKISGFRCVSCQLNFTKLSVMVEHVVKKHTESYLQCSKCTLAFKNEHSLLNHYANVHSMQVDEEHIKSLKHLFKCLICNELVIGEDAIKSHINSIHVNLAQVRRFFYFRCPPCSKVYESKAELLQHLSSTVDEIHTKWKTNEAICDVCHETFPKYVEMIAHREANHRAAIDKFVPTVPILIHKPSKTAVKRNSDGNVTNEPGIRMMVCSHPNCAGSGNQFLYSFQLELHTSVNHAPRHCQFCDSIFHGSSAFEKHLLIDHGKGNVIDAFECVFCQSKFDNSVTRNHHVTLFHGWGQSVGGVSSSQSANSAIQSNNNSINKLECKVCNLTFEKFATCQDHFAVVHPSGFNFVCVNCPLPCDTELVIGAPKPSKFKTFDSLTEFKDHQIKHHKFDLPKPAKFARCEPNAEKLPDGGLFACIRGDFVTDDRGEFAWHIEQHADKKQPWQCCECGFNMAQEAGLRSHLATQHNITNYDEYKVSFMKKVSMQSSGEKVLKTSSLTSANPLVCDVCFRKFDQFVDYKSHRDAAHGSRA